MARRRRGEGKRRGRGDEEVEVVEEGGGRFGMESRVAHFVQQSREEVIEGKFRLKVVQR